MKLKVTKITERRVESEDTIAEEDITYAVKLSDKDGDNTVTLKTTKKPDYSVGSEFELRKVIAQTKLKKED